MMSQRALTLVEVLVVIAIIGILVALLLPARQAARQSSRDLNNLAQLSDFDVPAEIDAADESREKKGKGVGNETEVAGLARKIIYEAEIRIVVSDVTETEIQISRLVKEAGGYLADSTVDRRQGEQLSGRWRVRIPVGQFEPFLDAVSKLGVAESRRQSAQDVTEEFVDLEAQIANKKLLEGRILELLKDPSGEIKDVIEVERELARVRGEIERMEGRLRYLTNRTELTTVMITAREERDYVPPEAPSFASRVGQAWASSFDSLQRFGERVAVAAVFAIPWVVLLTIIVVPIWFVGKRAVARKKTAQND